MIRHTKLGQTGDTIVEVLIATVVVSAVIVGAFSIANKSSLQIRQAQERGEALKIAASAVETIKGRTTDAVNETPPVLLVQDIPVCADFTPAIMSTGSLPVPQPLPLLVNDNNDIYSANCRRSPSNGVDYYTSITKRKDATGLVSFEVHTRWDKIGGGERQDVLLTYRLDR